MRTLLTGEFATATAWDSDRYVKFEVQNGSGTWIDVGALLGTHWVVNASWSETVDQPVSQITVTLVPYVAADSLSPLMSTSPLNVDDLGAYSPQLEMGRLCRVNVATMPKGVTLDTGKYREIFTGRIDEVDESEDQSGRKPITVMCSDLGAWLMDIEIESTTDVQYGTDTPPGTALETVLQSIIDDNIPSGEPAVTLYKQSASTFAVTPKYTQTQDKLFPPLVNIVLDTTGEDLRYRYDASHVSRLTWFNPDRSRTSVDATFDVNGYVVQKLNRQLANIRNAGRIPSPETAGTFVTNTDTSVTLDSRAKYRRRFMQLPASSQLTSDAQAQTVIDAAVNDLAGAPIEASFVCPFLWFVQLFDRYTFPANGRQYDADQTLAVVGFTHTIESGRGQTVLSLTGRVVGAYAAWRQRVALGGSVAAGPTCNLSIDTEADGTFAVTLNGAFGDGGKGPLQWRYRLSDGTGPGAWTSWSAVALPFTISDSRLAKNSITVEAETMQGDGQTAQAVLPLRGHLPIIDSGTDPTGLTLHTSALDHGGRPILNAFDKASSGDSDTADSVRPGIVKRVPVVGATDSSGNIDLSGPGWVPGTKHMGNLPDDPTSRRFAGVQAGAAGGTEILSNPDFAGASLAGWAVYDNNSTGHVTFAIGAATNTPNSTGNALIISVSAGGESPGFGGFAWALPVDSGNWAPDTYHRGGTYTIRIAANIPVGLSLNFNTNAIGTGGTFGWLTDAAGQGIEVEYVGLLTVGATGSFGTTGFFYLSGSIATPFTWFVYLGSFKAIHQSSGLINFGSIQHANKHLDSIPDGPSGTRAAIHGSYIDSSNRPITLRDPIVNADVAVVDVNESTGRSLAGFDSSGDIKRNVPRPYAAANLPGVNSSTGKIDPGQPMSGTPFRPLRHIEQGTVLDGTTATFSVSFDNPPNIGLWPQVFSGQASLSQSGDVRPTSVTVSTFTARGKWITGGSTTPESEDFAATLGGTTNPSGIAINTDGGVAWSTLANANTALTTYHVNYDVDFSGCDGDTHIAVSVHKWDGATLTLVGSASYFGGQTLTGESISFSDTLSSSESLRVLTSYTFGGTTTTGTLTAKHVTYNKATAGTEMSMAGTGQSLFYLAQENV